DNTDYRGFLYMLGRAGISVKGKNTLVLGSGGSSHTVCAALEDEGAKKITVFKRSDIENYANLIIDKEIQIIINCTPVGMYPDNGKSPVNLSDFPKCEAVADLIYNPDKTELLLQAKKLGLNYVNGLTMLVAQAKYSSELFTGTQLDEAMIEKALKSVRNEMRNIVLIGMPGSGKTSVGKRLSELMKRRFFDSDEIITRVYEKNPAEIIEKKGESFFRLIAATVISEAGKATSAVISTGGGAVINEQNIDYLRQNGIIIFLERDLGLLDVTCRPLSSGKNALQALYNARIPL
ncbi:MAG TPA: shikimate kinase, partial [Clostridiales bacterium]|nr:shikimate kinase [Clostridiales bacterium]